jgi:hypothetical protein
MRTRVSRTARFWRAGVGTRVGFLLALVLGGLHGGGQEPRDLRDAQPRLARIPGAVWLTGYPLHATWLTTSSGTVRVQSSAGESRAVAGPWITASMTRDNQLRDGEKWTMDIRLLDLARLRLKTKFKDVPPVFGWAAESPELKPRRLLGP